MKAPTRSGQIDERRGQSAILIVARRRGRNTQFAADIALGHREHAAGEVAEVIGQIGVVAIDHAVVGEITVEAVSHFAHHEVAQDVGPVGLFVTDGVAHVAGTFRHPRAAEIEPAVDVQVFEELIPSGSEQHRRPIDGVGLEDVLADEMLGMGPNLALEMIEAKIGGGLADVGPEGVVPDVSDVVGIEGEFDAPVHPGFRAARYTNR